MYAFRPLTVWTHGASGWTLPGGLQSPGQRLGRMPHRRDGRRGEFIHRRSWTLPGPQLDFAGIAREKKPQNQYRADFIHWTLPGILIDQLNAS